MNNKIDVEKFILLYKNLTPKTHIISILNITDYMYEKIIQIYGLKREKTCKCKRLYITLQQEQEQNKLKHTPIDVSYAPFNTTNKI